MTKARGGIIGVLASNLSGVFTLREAQTKTAQGQWNTGPNQPTGFTVAPQGNVQLTLNWTAPNDLRGSTLTGYRVEYTAAGSPPQFVSTNSTATSYTLTGLANDVLHTIRVAAESSLGAGEWSSSASATPRAVVTVEYLVVAGGGGGGGSGNGGGGGGAGGLLTGTFDFEPAITRTITVGSGGGGSALSGSGGDGQTSVFATFTALGGGGGGNYATRGRSGGSGGGTGRDGGNNVGAAGTTGQGFKGGDNIGGAWRSGSGGGGAGAAGEANGGDSNNYPGTGSRGGIGLLSSITGVATYYAGGGAGSWWTGSTKPAGGLGGGGGSGGGGGGQSVGSAGAANTGGGGGGGTSGGTGGSGVVILAVLGDPPVTISGFTLNSTYTKNTTARPGYAVYRFTSGTGSITF